ncbi:hypothetical protein C8J55DRAFT_502752, partial [Lentinula edodes]
ERMEELTLPSLHNLPSSKRAFHPDDEDDDEEQHHSTPPQPPTKKQRVVSPIKRYNLRERRPPATTLLPPSRLRNILSVESSQSQLSTVPKGRRKGKARTTR